MIYLIILQEYIYQNFFFFFFFYFQVEKHPSLLNIHIFQDRLEQKPHNSSSPFIMDLTRNLRLQELIIDVNQRQKRREPGEAGNEQLRFNILDPTVFIFPRMTSYSVYKAASPCATSAVAAKTLALRRAERFFGEMGEFSLSILHRYQPFVISASPLVVRCLDRFDLILLFLRLFCDSYFVRQRFFESLLHWDGLWLNFYQGPTSMCRSCGGRSSRM